VLLLPVKIKYPPCERHPRPYDNETVAVPGDKLQPDPGNNTEGGELYPLPTEIIDTVPNAPEESIEYTPLAPNPPPPINEISPELPGLHPANASRVLLRVIPETAPNIDMLLMLVENVMTRPLYIPWVCAAAASRSNKFGDEPVLSTPSIVGSGVLEIPAGPTVAIEVKTP